MTDLPHAAGLDATEAECAAGRTAPRVSLADIEANILGGSFVTGEQFMFAGGEQFRTGDASIEGTPGEQTLRSLTICLLVLRNGFTIIGKSAPADPRNFDEQLGRKLAHEDAVRQVWPLMGYELRERLYRQEQPEKFDRMDAEMQNLDVTEQPAPPASPVAMFEPAADMVRHIGTKIVDARPMTRGDYCAVRGWNVPQDEKADDAGYLVEYTDKADSNLEGFRGYVTWSPADVFEMAYRPL